MNFLLFFVTPYSPKVARAEKFDVMNTKIRVVFFINNHEGIQTKGLGGI